MPSRQYLLPGRRWHGVSHDRFSFDQAIVDVAFHRFGSEDMPLTKEVRSAWINRFDEIYSQSVANDTSEQGLGKTAERRSGRPVCHATPIRVFAAHCLNKALDEIKEVPWPTNASVTKAEYDGKRFRLTDYSLDGFMGELITKLPKNV